MRQRFARTLTRHFDQTKLRESAHGHASAVARKRFLELCQHRVLVFGAHHVNEIDDDDAAEIAQPQLRAIACAASRFVL